MTEDQSLMQRAFNEMAHNIASLGLHTNLDVSRTLDHVTMTVRRGYADASDVIIGYTLTQESGGDVDDVLRPEPVLTDGHGRNIECIGGPSSLGYEDGRSAWIVWFTGAEPAGQGQVELRFQQGPFVFNFALPVAPSRLLVPRRTSEADGWRITLVRASVAPSGARFTLAGAGLDAEVKLIAAGSTYKLYHEGGSIDPEMKRCFDTREHHKELWKDWETHYVARAMVPAGRYGNGLAEDTAKTRRWLAELQAAEGEWILVATPDASRPNPVLESPPGRWTFHFTLPSPFQE